MSRAVLSPDGHEWIVRRRWVPRLGPESMPGRFWRRIRRTAEKTADGLDPVSGCFDALGEGIVAAIGIILVALLLFFVVIPLLVAIVDALILLVLALLSVAARIALRRPWLVEARADNGIAWRWRVVGWRASGERVAELEELLANGAPLPAGAIPD